MSSQYPLTGRQGNQLYQNEAAAFWITLARYSRRSPIAAEFRGIQRLLARLLGSLLSAVLYCRAKGELEEQNTVASNSDSAPWVAQLNDLWWIRLPAGIARISPTAAAALTDGLALSARPVVGAVVPPIVFIL